MSDNGSTTNNTVLTFAAGLAVGGIGALLLAPKSGDETRGQIRDSANAAIDAGREKVSDAADQVANTTRRAGGTVNDSASSIGDAARDQAEAVREAFESGRQAYAEELQQRKAASS